jgi:hypothetical protein
MLIQLERGRGPDGVGGGAWTPPPDRGQSSGPGSRAILERIVRGDPLGMAGRCRRRLRERALLISLRRFVARSLAHVALDVDRTGADALSDRRVQRSMDTAIEALLCEDRRGVAAPGDARYHFAAAALCVSSDCARRTLVAFNALPIAERARYWASFIEPGPAPAPRPRTSDRTAGRAPGCRPR